MDIINLINNINNAYERVYDDIRMPGLYKCAILNFTNGYCYEFFCILKYFYPDAILLISNDKMHCAALIEDEVYDATGKREDTINFRVANGCDLEYIYKYYGFFTSNFKTLLKKEIKKNVSNNSKTYVKSLNKTYKYSII